MFSTQEGAGTAAVCNACIMGKFSGGWGLSLRSSYAQLKPLTLAFMRLGLVDADVHEVRQLPRAAREGAAHGIQQLLRMPIWHGFCHMRTPGGCASALSRRLEDCASVRSPGGCASALSTSTVGLAPLSGHLEAVRLL